MATELVGKKIDQLNESLVITDETVIPGVVVQGGVPQSTATKLSIKTIKSDIQKGVLLQPNIVEDLVSTDIELNQAVRNTIYQYGTLSSLKINGFDKSYFKTIIYFKTGENPTNLSFLTEPTWINDEPDIKANGEYIITICNGLATIDSSNDSGGSTEQSLQVIAATGGTVPLKSEGIYSMVLSEATSFVLPTSIDRMLLNQILVQLNITAEVDINWGTTNYFCGAPSTSIGKYNMIWEYDNNMSAWVVGQLEKIEG